MSGTWLPGDEGLQIMVEISDDGRATFALRDPRDWIKVWGPPRPLEQRAWRTPVDGPSW